MNGAALALRRIGIDTWRENVAFLHRECPVVRAEGFQALAKVTVSVDGRAIAAVLNVVDDAAIVAPHELGLSEEAFARLGAPAGTPVSVAQAEPPPSLGALRRKIGGERLGRDELHALVADIAAARYSKVELAAFVVATQQLELDRDEVLYLTEAMIAVGHRLAWDAPLVVDKHCIGGIPGNRTSMLVVPIVAAHGLTCPKTSSRAITSPAGTADTMEVLADVELAPGRLQQIVRTTGGCLAWGGTAGLSPADDVLISVERPLAIDSPGQMVASILSKKIAAGSTHLVLDIPVGPSAKVRDELQAQRLRRLFEYVAGRLGLQLEVVLTDGRQPVGRGIGPVLEARDVLQVLRGDPAAPADLRAKALLLAGRMIEFDPAVPCGDGERIALEILDSGRARAKMEQIVDAQGRRTPPAGPGPLVFEVTAAHDGVVTAVDNLRLARIARLTGAPQVPAAGMDLRVRLGDRVVRGQPLYRLHACFEADLAFARRMAGEGSAVVIAG